ncbi:MAG: NUDIX hydrolase [Rhizobiaceae bacterium]|nr:NUDIX hydrolase [Rhizobiaceae bacterium]
MALVTMKTDAGQLDKDLEIEIDRLQQMIRSPQMRKMRARVKLSGSPPLRPRNAATIILIDGKPGNFRILMGQRNKALKFMPGALVFPGGAVDRADGNIPAIDELDELTAKRILNNLRARPTPRAARALALACTRELAEETGLLMGKQTNTPPVHDDWHFFKDLGLAPAISPLRLLARATTPPGAPRRFDTWFFTAPASAIAHTPKGGFSPSGELENLRWLTPQEAIGANTQEITRVILVELINRLKVDPQLSPEYSAPNYYFKKNFFHRDVME